MRASSFFVPLQQQGLIDKYVSLVLLCTMLNGYQRSRDHTGRCPDYIEAELRTTAVSTAAEIKQVICSAERYGPVITTSYSKAPAGKAFGGSETDVTEMGAAGKTREK